MASMRDKFKKLFSLYTLYNKGRQLLNTPLQSIAKDTGCTFLTKKPIFEQGIFLNDSHKFRNTLYKFGISHLYSRNNIFLLIHPLFRNETFLLYTLMPVIHIAIYLRNLILVETHMIRRFICAKIFQHCILVPV